MDIALLPILANVIMDGEGIIALFLLVLDLKEKKDVLSMHLALVLMCVNVLMAGEMKIAPFQLILEWKEMKDVFSMVHVLLQILVLVNVFMILLMLKIVPFQHFK